MREEFLRTFFSPQRRKERSADAEEKPQKKKLCASFAALCASAVKLALLCLLSATANAQAKRVVVIKADGLSPDHIERFVAERNPATGESLLPVIKRVFYDNGSVVQNFYTRGLSLSAPSWSLLDTGQHLQIKGNVEYDRFTLRTYDYLNFFPFYVGYFRSQQVDKIGVEVLDSVNIPLLFDAFDYRQRYQSYQLFQRGARWTTLGDAARQHFAGKSLRDLAGEWAGGIDFRGAMTEQYERDVIARLNDPNVKYLDIFTAEFDHVAHLNRDRASLLAALQNIDAMVGRVWQAIECSPLADETVLVLLSDHSLNTDERIYSQGFNLVSLFNSAAGGAHHVVTNRYPLGAYQFKSFNPMADIAVTKSKESVYLKGEASKYPTALMDLDGNERAAIHLRNSDLNSLHLLLLRLKDKKLTTEERTAATESFFQIAERNRPRWSKTLNELTEELGALRRFIAQQGTFHRAQPKEFSAADKDAGFDKESRRVFARLNQAREDEAAYSAYLRTLQNLLALKPTSFNPSKIKIEDLIAPRAMGEPNSIHQLQNYVAGSAWYGTGSGSDSVSGESVRLTNLPGRYRSLFRTVNYFSLLTEANVRNNAQPGVDSHPVDFIAVRIPLEEITSALTDDERPDQDAIWLYGGQQRQALILSRKSPTGEFLLRYLPVADLTQALDGAIRFRRIGWQSKLPLKIWEDEELNVFGNRADWLSRWHSELDWLHAIHQTKYANGLIGLHEQLTQHKPPNTDDSPDGKLLRRFWLRQRRLAEADLLALASDHWNFNARDFNAGGNHGSLFRVSTHSTLMFAGGARTGIPKARLIEEPYDSLSFAPTVFSLLNHQPITGAFPGFPGRIIQLSK